MVVGNDSKTNELHSIISDRTQSRKMNVRSGSTIEHILGLKLYLDLKWITYIQFIAIEDGKMFGSLSRSNKYVNQG